MKLIPASGSKEIQNALEHQHVCKIVDFLLHIIDQDLFGVVASFLKNHDGYTQINFTEDLQDLRIYDQGDPNKEGTFVVSPFIDGLIATLEALYKQDQRKIDFHRGAILELLAFRLVSKRCKEQECRNNYRFIDQSSRYASDQIDVAIYSEQRQEIEAYECKVKAEGITSVNFTNLIALIDKATQQGYDARAGFICFDSGKNIWRRIKKFPLADWLDIYGLDNFQDLQENPFDV